jgi:uncharacterized protein YyaL (SSP411 family)
MTADDHEDLIAREKPGYDGAVPSGNAIAVMNLLRLAVFTSDDTYRQRAADTMAAFSKSFRSSPLGLSEMMLALDFSLASPTELVIVTPENTPRAGEPFLKAFRNVYLPNRVLIQVKQGKHAAKLATLMPLVKGKADQGVKPVAYVCAKGICHLPSFKVEAFTNQLRQPPG